MEKANRPLIAGNTNTALLKIAALVFMCFDHFGKMLFPTVLEMRMVGRLAFPIYCWCLVVGFCYTRNQWKYVLRIAAVGLVSQPLYMVALEHTWQQPNIFLTLLLGLLGMIAVREKKFLSQWWGPVIVLSLAVLLRCDYDWRGVMLILLLYAARQSRSALAATFIAFCLFWGSNSTPVYTVFGWFLPVYMITGINQIFASFLRLQGLAILALPFIICPMGKPFRMKPIFGYLLYPAHLAVLWLCQMM